MAKQIRRSKFSTSNVTTTASLNGDIRTFDVSMFASKDKADSFADDAARFYYELGWDNNDVFKTDTDGVLTKTGYDDLTNAQKMSILGIENKYHLMLGARSYYGNLAIDIARENAEIEIETRY